MLRRCYFINLGFKRPNYPFPNHRLKYNVFPPIAKGRSLTPIVKGFLCSMFKPIHLFRRSVSLSDGDSANSMLDVLNAYLPHVFQLNILIFTVLISM